MERITEELEKIVGKKNIYTNEPMKKHTSFKIGGIADFFIIVQNKVQLKEIFDLANSNNIPFMVIGNGTNLLVREGGIRGFVIKLDFKDYSIDLKDECAYVTCGSGMTLAQISQIALENNLTGLEELSGIPGTIGGAIRMNAGAYGREMKDIVVCSKCMDYVGNIYELDLDSHLFEYRKSAFEKNGLIILETTIELKIGKKEEIKLKMEEVRQRRLEKQPLEFSNAGSTFKRLENNIPTAKLVEECGLKGFAIGDAMVSEKHSGFIINKGNATADEVLELIDYVKNQVREKFNIDINLEIIVIGEE